MRFSKLSLNSNIDAESDEDIESTFKLNLSLDESNCDMDQFMIGSRKQNKRKRAISINSTLMDQQTHFYFNAFDD